MIFCLSSQDPNSEASYLPFSKFAGNKNTISHHFHPFFRVVKRTKEATKMAFIFPCRNTSPHKIDVTSKMSRRWSSNWPRKTPSLIGKIRINMRKIPQKRGWKTAKTWFPSLQELPRLKPLPGCSPNPVQRFEKVAWSIGGKFRFWEFSFPNEVPKIRKIISFFLGPRNSSTSSSSAISFEAAGLSHVTVV